MSASPGPVSSLHTSFSCWYIDPISSGLLPDCSFRLLRTHTWVRTRTPTRPQARAVVRASCDGTFAVALGQAELAQLGYLVGTTVHAQVVYRDPGLPAPPVATTDSLVFTILP